MQSFRWYRNRLLSMSPAEIVWRVRNAVRDRMDGFLLGSQQRRITRRALQLAAQANNNDRYRPTATMVGSGGARLPAAWAEQLEKQATDIVDHRVHLFGKAPTDLGQTIRWNFEYQKQAATPTDFIGRVDYRDYREVGDCKWVWELSRHHHLVVLGRAYWVTGSLRYAQEVRAQIKSWIDASPFGTGMNWRSPLELSIRLINWVWALDLVSKADVFDSELDGEIAAVAEAHLGDVARKYSRYSSANNHLIGEAAGVYIGAAYFSHSKNAVALRAEAKRLLIAEMADQVDSDGIHRELALGYHLFVMQFFLLAWHAANQINDPFPQPYTDKLLKMANFLQDWSAAGEEGAHFGDADDGYVLDLGGHKGDIAGWVAAVRSVILNEDFTTASECEPCYWLAGRASMRGDDGEATEPTRSGKLSSRHFVDAGLCLMQARAGKQAKPVSVTFDVGPLGYKSIAAHGHADALSMTLRYNGVPFLVDAGTYDYFTYDEWRNYFRSTRAHNTVEIDRQDQSEMLGKFLWGARANTALIEWQDDDKSVAVTAEHDGYQRLPDPVGHRRSLRLDKVTGALVIEDTIEATGSHDAVLRFHCAPACKVEAVGKDDRTLLLSRPEGLIRLTLPDSADIRIHYAETDPPCGWFSPAYHQKLPTNTIAASLKIYGTHTVRTLVEIWEP